MKSEVLVIGDDPERLMERHLEAYGDQLVDVTAELVEMARQFACEVPPAGVQPTPEFRQKLAVRRAISRYFADGPVWVYETASEKPEQHILHDHVMLENDAIVAAFKKVLDNRLGVDPPEGYFSSNPFSSWWPHHTGLLPLRDLGVGETYHARTVIEETPYYANSVCANVAVIGDVDLDRIRAARQETTDDLFAKTRRHLADAGIEARFDWEPRYRMDWGEITENPTYFDQPAPKLLHDKMPEHARRIDFLLLDEADYRLYLKWSALPVASVVSVRGYETDIAYGSKLKTRDARFFQITQTSRAFLEAVGAAWEAAPKDELVTVFTAKE